MMENAVKLPICLSANGDVVTQSPDVPLRLLVATAGGLVHLERAAFGDPWRVVGKALMDTHPSALIVDEHTGTIYCGQHYSGGIKKSLDGGLTWIGSGIGLESDHVYMLALQRLADKAVLYCGTEPPMLYRSGDLGNHWQPLRAIWEVPDTDQWRFPPPPHIAHVKNIAFHPSYPETLYVCIEQGDLLKSTDAGASWRSLTSYETPEDRFRRDMHRIIIKPSDPSKLYLASGVGLYYSEDAGESWEHISRGDARVGYPDCLFFDPKDENILYMAGASGAPSPSWKELRSANPGILRSRDGGRSWDDLMNGLPNLIPGNIEAMCAHQSDYGLSMFAGTSVGDIWGSDDGGENWALIASNLPPISKGAHYRHFLSDEHRALIDDALKAKINSDLDAPINPDQPIHQEA
jgi:photosystem II stability/assembly factor-like uncharacterized protein